MVPPLVRAQPNKHDDENKITPQRGLLPFPYPTFLHVPASHISMPGRRTVTELSAEDNGRARALNGMTSREQQTIATSCHWYENTLTRLASPHRVLLAGRERFSPGASV
ncbi:hypothetical protein KM043_016759 [Ampulex compressa]|nr:hypothetical protein KM043_016759 [Ampulex compressa]